MNEYRHLYQYYSFFNNKYIVIARYLLFFAFLGVLLLSINNLDQIKITLSLYSLFLVNELFVHLHVNKIKPRKTVNEVEHEHFAESMFFRPRLAFDQSLDGAVLAKKLSFYPENAFIAFKIDGNFALPEVKIEKNDVVSKAYALVKSVKGKYITHLDLFAAYLLLSEPESHKLQNADMSEQDLVNIYYWARNKYKVDDKNKQIEITFYGDGAFDFFIFGWNYELKKYARSITSEVMSRKTPPSVMGRANEYEDLLVALSKPSGNSVLLVGEPGTGKTSLVEFYAYNSHLGKISGHHAHVYELLIDRLLAGVQSRGELEERLVYLIAEVGHSGDIVLLIQNIENIFGSGGFDFDLSGVLSEYLQKGNITLIGTTTQGAYKTYISQKAAASSIFSVINFSEPDPDTALFMLFEKIGDLEAHFGIDITYPAVKALVDLHDSYLLDRYLPGKAMTVLENIATSRTLKGKDTRIISKDDVHTYLTGQTRILIGDPTEDEKQLLLHLEDEMHTRVVSQDAAVSAVSSAMRRVRSGFSSGHRPIAVFLFLGPTGVGKTETAKALAELYFGDSNAMVRLDMSEYATPDSLNKLLGESVGGQYAEHALPELISQHPFSLVLLDEFEKAHPQVRNVFLQVFDDARLTDNKGRTISFKHTIIIATSNAGSEYVRQHTDKLSDTDTFKQELIEVLLQQQIFTPELINRFDDVIVFKPLTREDIGSVVQLLLAEAFVPLSEKQISVSFDTAAIEKIVNESYDEQFGARNVRRYIASTVQEFISQLILSDKISKGSQIVLSVDSANQFTVR